MYEKIKGKEIMTTWEARNKYRTKYFLMVITDSADCYDNSLGYVVCVADNKRELYKAAPRDDYKGLQLASMIGSMAEPYPLLGNIEYHGAL